jgi:UDP-galactopyranose mutase
MKCEVVIIGAGLTGLSAAYHLGLGYMVYEQASRVGGLCRSIMRDGFTFDQSIHILYTKNEYAAHFIQEVLLKGNFEAQPRESWVYSKGVYTEYPFQSYTYGLPPKVIVECIMGLIEARYLQRSRRKPANFEDWIYETFGKGIAKHFMIPYNRRVWAIDPKLMDYSWIAERVPLPTIEEVLLGALQPARKKVGFNNDFWYPRDGGIEALPQGFLPYLENIYLNSQIVKIYPKEKCVDVQIEGRWKEKVRYEHLISTVPLPVIVRLLDEVPGAIKRVASRLLSNVVYTVNIGITGELDPECSQGDGVDPKRFHWIYFPEDEFIFHRISFPKNFARSMCPEGMSSIQAEVSSTRYKPLNLEILTGEVIAGLRRAKILRRENEVVFSQVVTLNPAYVIYDRAHRRNVNLIKSYLEEYCIHACGRFGDWEYFNMDRCILRGKEIAEAIKR